MLDRTDELNETPVSFEAIGFARDGDLVGGVVYTNWHRCRGGGNIELWGAGHNWFSRRTLRVIFGYPFLQLGCHRVTAITREDNEASLRMLGDLGFTVEAVIRQGFAPDTDAVICGMLKNECRWIKGWARENYNKDA